MGRLPFWSIEEKTVFASPGFPAVHPPDSVGLFIGNENAQAGFDQVFHIRKKIVGAGQHFPAQLFGGKVS